MIRGTEEKKKRKKKRIYHLGVNYCVEEKSRVPLPSRGETADKKGREKKKRLEFRLIFEPCLQGGETGKWRVYPPHRRKDVPNGRRREKKKGRLGLFLEVEWIGKKTRELLTHHDPVQGPRNAP